ncbi:hypothetical protein [Thiothrix lacustris]|uniref:hypothetical protein n=1 Tax=Thiothrix lacustris TaxID=525917 RepID=UPI0027E5BD07|nr:hypothetical protein [Thiothrix lacustris]WMP15713.1 hypothetical protein RCS87_09930 [Thiothrix lacustris]
MLTNKNNKPTAWVKMGAAWSRSMIVGALLLLVNGASIAGENTLPPHNLSLSVSLPAALGVAVRDIGWQVQATDAAHETLNLVGLSPAVSLPAGQYEVSLVIGAYDEHKVVEVAAANMTTVLFTPSVGRLRVSSDAKDTDWSLTAVSTNTDAPKVLMKREDSLQIDTIVPTGDYDMLASRGDGISHTQRMSITPGGVNRANIQMPGGKVSLIATLNNGPALRPMSWTVYRLDGGRQAIAAPKRHSANLLVSPGHYEAVATLNGQERHRVFTVLTDTSNRIVVAMD